MTSEIMQQSNSSWERGWTVMARSKEGYAVGRDCTRRQYIFIVLIE